jgi:polygalacturonase
LASRREFLTAAVALPTLRLTRGFAPPLDLWSTAADILNRIATPRFPARTFKVTNYGATTTGDSTQGFREAIAACAAAGGGRVIVARGRFETGPIHLRSGVELHLEDGAVVAFTRDPNAYLPVVLTRYEGIEFMNYSPFIYAIDARNIAISGSGTLDGQADEQHWWNWRGEGRAADAPMTPARRRLFEMAERGVPVAERLFGAGSFMRPNFVQPYRCHNVLIDGVTISIHQCGKSIRYCAAT